MNYKSILKLKWPHKVPVQFLDDTYNGIVWNSLDQTPNPTKEELDIAINGTTSVVSVNNSDDVIGVFDYLKLYSLDVSRMSGNTLIPFDNTKPTSLEGSLIGSMQINPRKSDSQFVINGSFFVDSSTNNKNIIISVFRDTTCIHVATVNVSSSGRPATLTFNIVDAPVSSSLITYSFRIGAASSTTWYLNQGATSINFNGLSKSNITILEI